MPGPLVVVGGAEQRTAEGEVLKRFVELAGGPSAVIAVVPTASSIPEEVWADYEQAFTAIGVAEVRLLDVRTREQANHAAEQLQGVTGVYLTGGDQRRLATVLGGSQLDSALQALHDDGVVIGGTSAGSAVMSSTMVIGGSETVVSTEAVRTAPGLELVQGLLIDMHFAERGRIQRLVSAVALYPHQLGVGIDEDTALIVQPDSLEVIGSGAVTIVDAGAVTDCQVDPDTGRIAVTDLRLHCLPAGFSFDLLGRRPVISAAPEEARQEAGTSHADVLDLIEAEAAAHAG